MATTTLVSVNTIDAQAKEETTKQSSFFQKLRNFVRADARNLFERGYYSNFALRSGYPTSLDTSGLIITRHVSYVASDPQNENLQLDIIRPAGFEGKLLPVFIFVHGGAWRSADKSDFLKVHENLCIRLAKKGVVCINVNHRLAPQYQFPTAEQDVAAAVAWTYRHVAQYGGNPNQLFVSGHSSGGHITALVASDHSYLAAHGLPKQMIQGVISISGVMDVNHFYHHSYFMRNFSVKPYFGKDPIQYPDASPINFMSATTPPTFLAHAEQHDEGLDKQAQRAEQLLRKEGVHVQRKSYCNTDHFLILSKVNESSFLLTDDITRFISEVVAMNSNALEQGATGDA